MISSAADASWSSSQSEKKRLRCRGSPLAWKSRWGLSLSSCCASLPLGSFARHVLALGPPM